MKSWEASGQPERVCFRGMCGSNTYWPKATDAAIDELRAELPQFLQAFVAAAERSRRRVERAHTQTVYSCDGSRERKLLSESIAKLLSISSPPIADNTSDFPAWGHDVTGLGHDVTGLFPDLAQVLHVRNGFYAFESALHVFPIGHTALGRTLSEWNAPALWKAEYGNVLEGCLCFAEDIFGEQFCWRNGVISRFDPETAKFDLVASNLSKWAEVVLSNYDFQTGWSLAHEWQAANGPLAPGMRLVPTQPFVISGEYNSRNLGAVDAVEGMRFRAHIERQLRNVAPGTMITLKTTR